MTDKHTSRWKWILGIPSSLLAILGIIDWFIEKDIFVIIWNYIKAIVLSVYTFFTTYYQVQLWFLILLPLIGAGILFIINYYINKKPESGIKEPAASPPAFLKYTEDIFENVLFRWRWGSIKSGTYYIDNIIEFCKECKCKIVDLNCPVC